MANEAGPGMRRGGCSCGCGRQSEIDIIVQLVGIWSVKRRIVLRGSDRSRTKCRGRERVKRRRPAARRRATSNGR
eukprot:scaffold9301_cov30-Tisochrysis_lutea.AAC.11